VRRVVGALCVALSVLWACGVDTNGLLDLGDAGEEGPGADANGGAVDGTRDDTASSPDGGRITDGRDEIESSTDVAVQPPGDAPSDTPADRAGDAGADTQTDAPIDGQADAFDAQPDGPVDGQADGPTDASNPSDAAPLPLPIVWDGGAIADPQPFDSDWTLFCMTLAACGQVPSASACLSHLPQPSSPDALIPPFSTVSSVDVASPNCASVGAALGDGSMCPLTTADVCAGNSLVTCRFGFKMTVDCGRLGMVCSSGSGSAGCGFGDCAASQEGATYCVGSSYVAECSAGRYRPLLDCRIFGAGCVGPAGTAQCQGRGTMGCSGGPTCSGTSLVECFGGATASVDCVALYDPSFSCFAGNTAATCAAGTSCDPATYADTCGGMNSVNYCNAGAPANFNCRMSGWNRCIAGHCAP
jgi:hypothetical protein